MHCEAQKITAKDGKYEIWAINFIQDFQKQIQMSKVSFVRKSGK